jgi:hypothetical protein
MDSYNSPKGSLGILRNSWEFLGILRSLLGIPKDSYGFLWIPGHGKALGSVLGGEATVHFP